MNAVNRERSMLFVPASSWPMIEKAARSPADAVCLDLEDSVPDLQKAAARTNAIRALRELEFRPTLLILRINALNGPFAYRDLIEVIEAVGNRMHLIMLPKVGAREDVTFVDYLLGQIEQAYKFERRIGIEAQIETAAGFVNLRQIAQSSPRLAALVFGPGDYAASLRMPVANIGEQDENDGHHRTNRWHAVMHAIVAHARASGLRAIDGPFAAYKDTAAFERSCQISRAMGFDGKQCIHPAQLEIANRMFSSLPDEIAHARAVVKAHELAVSEGRGAASLDGHMIDAASIRMAQSILDRQP